MNLPRWLTFGVGTTSGLAVLATAGWWACKNVNPPIDVYHIREPVKLGVATCDDGGTLVYWLADKDGRHLSFCADARSWHPGYYGIFAGGYPTEPGAIQLTDGGPEQAALCPVLDDWIANHDIEAAKEPPDQKHRWNRELVAEFAKVLHERLKQHDGSEKKIVGTE